MNRLHCLALFAMVALVGCGKSSTESTQQEAKKTQEDVLMMQQRKLLEQAKEIEKTLKDVDEQRRKAIDGE